MLQKYRASFTPQVVSVDGVLGRDAVVIAVIGIIEVWV